MAFIQLWGSLTNQYSDLKFDFLSGSDQKGGYRRQCENVVGWLLYKIYISVCIHNTISGWNSAAYELGYYLSTLRLSSSVREVITLPWTSELESSPGTSSDFSGHGQRAGPSLHPGNHCPFLLTRSLNTVSPYLKRSLIKTVSKGNIAKITGLFLSL